MPVPARRLATLSLVVMLAAVAPAAGDDVVSSSFAPLSGADACFLQAEPAGFYDGYDVGDCRTGHGLMDAESVAVSPDQQNVYVASSGSSSYGSNAVVAYGRDATTGALDELGCISNDGGDGRPGSTGLCTDGDALRGAAAIAVSPDGKDVYVAARSSGGLTTFSRDPATGKLTQAGCFKAYPQGDDCAYAAALRGAQGVAVSPDGVDVYVASGAGESLDTFARDPATGKLSKRGCISDTGDDGLCTNGSALNGASDVAVAPDGRQVYVTSADISAVSVYDRDPATGALKRAACFLEDAPHGGACSDLDGIEGASSIALSPGGTDVYVASVEDDTLVTFARDTDTGALTPAGCVTNADPTGADDQSASDDDSGDDDSGDDDSGDDPDQRSDTDHCDSARALYGVSEVTVSADGRSVFAGGNGSLTAFDRNRDTGAIHEVGCVESNDEYVSCPDVPNLGDVDGLASSADGRSLYAVTDTEIAAFGATVAITSRRTHVSRAGVARVALACPLARTRGCVGRLAFAGHRDRRFHIARGRRRTVSVRVPSALQARLRRHGRAHVIVHASDARHLTRRAARRVLFRR